MTTRSELSDVACSNIHPCITYYQTAFFFFLPRSVVDGRDEERFLII